MIYIKPNTKNESVHIPVILSQTGMIELVYNDFHIGENSDVTIVAGCGIHNGGNENQSMMVFILFLLVRMQKLNI